MKTFKQHLEEDLASVQKVNRKKEASMKKINKEKENSARKLANEKEIVKRDSERDKKQAEREKERDSNKRESIIQKVAEYITTDNERKKCAGGDGRRTENHDCDKIHSGMSHKEWEISQDTPKDETR